MASLAIAQQKTDEQMNRTEEQMRRTDEQIKRTDEKLERMGVTLGNIGRNQGEVAEEFFFNSMTLLEMTPSTEAKFKKNMIYL